MGIFKSLESMPESVDSTPIGVKFSIKEYNNDSFLEKINDGSLGFNQIKNNILKNYDEYMNYDNFLNPSTSEVFQKIWTNENFLRAFLDILNTTTIMIDRINLLSINKISYDYYCLSKKNNNISNILLRISEIINRTLIVQLCSVMDYQSAKFIALAHRSSFKPEERVIRLNEFIIRLGYDFTVKDIIYIYSKTYDEEFSLLFIYSMCGDHLDNVYDNYELQKEFDRISYALLIILESMTKEEMYKTLKRYGNYISLMNNTKKVRFSLHNLSNEFSRITTVVELLEEDGVKII